MSYSVKSNGIKSKKFVNVYLSTKLLQSVLRLLIVTWSGDDFPIFDLDFCDKIKTRRRQLRTFIFIIKPESLCIALKCLKRPRNGIYHGPWFMGYTRVWFWIPYESYSMIYSGSPKSGLPFWQLFCENATVLFNKQNIFKTTGNWTPERYAIRKK